MNSEALKYLDLIRQYAQDPIVSVALVLAVIDQESSFDPRAESLAGARGLMQIMPETAKDIWVRVLSQSASDFSSVNLFDPTTSIKLGTAYLKWLSTLPGLGRTENLLAGYNAGPGAVQHYGGVPPYAETQAYVKAVTAKMAEYHSELEKSVGNRSKWLVVAPPDNWRAAISVDDPTNYQTLAKLLDLPCKVRQDLKKVFVGIPRGFTPPPSPKPAKYDVEKVNPVSFPSGIVLSAETDDRFNKPDSWYRSANANPAPLFWLTDDNLDSKLSAHFRLHEFACHDTKYTALRVDPLLVLWLESVRSKLGVAIGVSSAYRPPPYNATLPGAALNSYHCDGRAADIFTYEGSGVSLDRLYDVVVSVVKSSGGVGYYPSGNFVHLDTRGYESRWTG